MIHVEPARTSPGPLRTRTLRVAGVAVALAATGIALGLQAPGPDGTAGPGASSAQAVPTVQVPSVGDATVGEPSAGTGAAPGGLGRPVFDGGVTSQPGVVLGPADGAIADGTSVFDDGVPGIANLDPVLLGALRAAATEAGRSGVSLVVDSGWRSTAYQESLLANAIRKYGSVGEASRWVASPDRSAHVSGDAVDLGPKAGRAWLAERGAAYGLCQIYDNEPWHYELRPDAPASGCPARYTDAAHDPRLQP